MKPAPTKGSGVRVPRASLLAALRAAYPNGASYPVDLPALLFALATWESGRELAAVGDGGKSLGLFQVYQPFWADEGRAGPFDVSKATPTPERAGDAPADRERIDVTIPDALGYELAYVRPLVSDLLRVLIKGMTIIGHRVEAGHRFVFNAARDTPVWASVVWQYGEGALQRWLGDPETIKLTADGYKTHRLANGLSLQFDHDKRQRHIEENYLASIADPEQVVRALGTLSRAVKLDLVERAALALKLGARRAAELAKEYVGKGSKLAKDLAGAAADPWLPDPRIIGTSMLTVALVGLVAYQLATVPTPHGRDLRPEIKNHAVAWAVGALATAFVLPGIPP